MGGRLTLSTSARRFAGVPYGPLLATISLGLILQAAALYWDVWTHVVIGRETFFSAPHLLLYTGFGLVALGGIAGCLRGVAGQGPMGPRLHVLGLAVPIEFFLIGIGALFQTVAFPWDEAWHLLVSRGEVTETFWSPPHAMAIGGGILAAFGFVLAVAVARETRTWSRGLALVVQGWSFGQFLFALHVLLGLADFSEVFQGDVFRDAAVYPSAVAVVTPVVLVMAVVATRRPGLATLAAIFYTIIRWPMVSLDFAAPPPVLVVAPIVDALYAIPRADAWPAVRAALAGGLWAIGFYGVYIWTRGLPVEPLFVALFSFTVFIAGVISGLLGVGLASSVRAVARMASPVLHAPTIRRSGTAKGTSSPDSETRG